MIAKVVLGIVFASIDLKSTGLILHFSNEASISSRSRSKTTAVTAFVFGVTAVLNIMFLTHSQSTPALIHGITTLQIVSIVAYYDLLTGHIPALTLITLICAAIFGWMPFLLNYQINLFLIGGLSNLLIAWIIYHFGVLYPQKSTQKAEKFPAFGYGDIYGLGVIGFLNRISTRISSQFLWFNPNFNFQFIRCVSYFNNQETNLSPNPRQAGCLHVSCCCIDSDFYAVQWVLKKSFEFSKIIVKIRF